MNNPKIWIAPAMAALPVAVFLARPSPAQPPGKEEKPKADPCWIRRPAG